MALEAQPNRIKAMQSDFEQSPFVKIVNQNLKGDKLIWLVALSLSVISILVVYSATGTLAYRRLQGNTEYYLFKHGILIALSIFLIWICHQVDYRYYSRISRIALLVSVPLLLLSWKFGVTINEASRWITIPLINQSFQPSDLAKLALIANIAAMLAKRQYELHDFKTSIQPVLIWTGVICALIGLSNFSNAVLLFLTCMMLIYIGRIPTNYLILMFLVGATSIMMALYVGERFGTARSRIEQFTNPEEIHFQAQQSYIAIATGGLLGKGPGNSDQKNFLPHPYSDFIYAIILEEYGLLGGLLVLGLYVLLLYRGMVVMLGSKLAFGGLLSVGLSFSIVMQALLNMCVAVGLVPITGIPLPMVSMGGTSLLFTGMAIGIILSVSRGEIDENVPLGNDTTGTQNLVKS